jgi:hypothetical protein
VTAAANARLATMTRKAFMIAETTGKIIDAAQQTD